MVVRVATVPAFRPALCERTSTGLTAHETSEWEIRMVAFAWTDDLDMAVQKGLSAKTIAPSPAARNLRVLILRTRDFRSSRCRSSFAAFAQDSVAREPSPGGVRNPSSVTRARISCFVNRPVAKSSNAYVTNVARSGSGTRLLPDHFGAFRYPGRGVVEWLRYRSTRRRRPRPVVASDDETRSPSAVMTIRE